MTSVAGARPASTPPSTPTATSTTSSGCRSGRRRRRHGVGRRPEVIAHHALPARFDRYIFTAGYNTIINRRQFGFTDLVWPTEYRYPDRTYHDTLDVSVGGLGFALRHEKGETDDHTITWQPDTRVLCCGDLFIWASPNAGNPQKVQRYPREWADALRRMLELDAEFLLPGHGFPVIGADRVRQALTDTADLLDSLVDQTLAVMNAGGRLDDAIHTVRVPAALADRPFLQPVYDEPEFIVHTVWRQYGGWWDGNPATLKPAPERALSLELAALAGGASALAERALQLLADATDAPESEPRSGPTGPSAWPATSSSTPGWPSPTTKACSGRRQQVFAARAARATSTMARGVFTWASNESARPVAGDAHRDARRAQRTEPARTAQPARSRALSRVVGVAGAPHRIPVFGRGSLMSAAWTRR